MGLSCTVKLCFVNTPQKHQQDSQKLKPIVLKLKLTVINEFTLATLASHSDWYTEVLIAQTQAQNLFGSLPANGHLCETKHGQVACNIKSFDTLH